MRRFRFLLRTLRGRLLVVLLGATVVGLLAMGFASVVLLRHSLISNVDNRLALMSQPWVEGNNPPPRPPPDEGRASRKLPTEFRVQLFDDAGNPVGDVLGPTESDPSRPLIKHPNRDVGKAFTVAGSQAGPYWRVRTVHLPRGGWAALALSLENVDLTVRRLVVIELAVGAVVISVLAAAATVTVRLGLRPLTRIEHTADAIAAGELDRRIPDQDPRTETGRLGNALNTMLSRLVTALQERQQSEHRLRRFVADASHELRTPLTSIRGFAELYRRSEAPRPEDAQAMMARIESEALRMGDLVEDLLLLARLDRERAVDLVSVDLVPLVQEVVQDAQVRSPEREITAELPESALRVLGDSHRLRQVFNNLLTNAVVHTTAGTPISVRVLQGTASEGSTATAGAEVEPAEPMGVVEIADTGPGIEAEHARQIFDRFYRVDDGRQRSEGGTGLGLAITAAIAEAHNGRVELVSNEAGGSTFRVLVPLS
jgi:two-component system OmpR family sensor kinase